MYAQKADSLKMVNLNEVTVSSFRVKSDLNSLPQTIQVLKKTDIQEVPNESLSELLKKTSGVDVVEYPAFLSSIGMRGFSPSALNGNYTMLMVNGLPSGTANVSTLDMNNAEQVEVLKGPYSSFFGSGAMAGVVNVVTPMSTDTIHSKIGVSYGSFNTYSIKAQSGGAITDKLSYDFSGNLMRECSDYKTGNSNLLNMSTYDKEIMGNSYGQTFQNTSFTKYDGNLRLGYSFSKDWMLNLYENVFVADPIYDNGNFWGSYGSTEKSIRRWSQSLSLTGKIGDNSLKFSPYYSSEMTKYYNSATDSNYVSNSNSYKSYGFVLQDGIKLGDHYAIVGIDNHSEKYVNQVWAAADDRTTPYQPDYLNSANGIFAQLRFNFLHDKLTTAIGGRYDLTYFSVYKTAYLPTVSSSDTYKTFNPNINVKYAILPELNVHASAGTAFLAPTAFEKAGIYSVSSAYGVTTYTGNPSLQPEKSKTYDVGFAYNNVHYGISADVTYFKTKRIDMIVSSYNASNDTITFKNAQSATMDGMECSLAYDFGSLSGYKYSLKVYGNLTHLSTSTVTSDGVISPMKYVRKDNASFGVEYHDFKAFAFRLNGRFVGHRYEDNYLDTWGTPVRPALVNDAVLDYPDFMVFDLSGSYTLSKKYTFGLTIANMLNENYSEKDGYNMPGRSITASVSYSF